MNGLEIYVMCEIPNNVIQIDAFARLFDGFSIGSNDLTQLVLGVDRDSAIVVFDFDERDDGVKAMIRQTFHGPVRTSAGNGRRLRAFRPRAAAVATQSCSALARRRSVGETRNPAAG